MMKMTHDFIIEIFPVLFNHLGISVTPHQKCWCLKCGKCLCILCVCMCRVCVVYCVSVCSCAMLYVSMAVYIS